MGVWGTDRPSSLIAAARGSQSAVTDQWPAAAARIKCGPTSTCCDSLLSCQPGEERPELRQTAIQPPSSSHSSHSRPCCLFWDPPASRVSTRLGVIMGLTYPVGLATVSFLVIGGCKWAARVDEVARANVF